MLVDLSFESTIASQSGIFRACANPRDMRILGLGRACLKPLELSILSGRVWMLCSASLVRWTILDCFSGFRELVETYEI